MEIKEKLLKLMNEKQISFAKVAKATGLSATTINLWVHDNYVDKKGKIADTINVFIESEREKDCNARNIIPFVELSTSKYIFEIARLCHSKGDLGVCYGKPGVGKTAAVKEYVKQFPETVLIEVDVSFTAKALLLEIHKRLNLSGKGSIYSLTCEIIERFCGSSRLMIIDEAEHLPIKGLELLRRIQDKTGVGVLLVGTPKLVENIRGKANELQQLYSRVDWGKSLESLLVLDAEKILSVANIDSKLAPVFLRYSKGNARAMTKLLLRSKSVAEINNRELLDEEIVAQASQLLLV